MADPESAANEFNDGSDQAANASIAYLLTVNGIQALFTGDIEPKAHGGSQVRSRPGSSGRSTSSSQPTTAPSTGSTKELLDAIDPRWAVSPPAPAIASSIRRRKPSLASSPSAVDLVADTNGSITARISAAGRLTWRASLQRAPWWSGRDQQQNGTCAGR